MSDLHFEILAHEMTPLGVLCLRRRELLCEPGTIVTEVTLNHEFLMSSLYTDSERALARTAMQMHAGADLRVLVGGLGLGYTAREALLSERVAGVEVVELLPPVIDWLRNDLVPLSCELRDERRLVITPGDVFRRLRGPADDLFDVILIDVDHSPEDTWPTRAFRSTRRLAYTPLGDIWRPTAYWRCGPTRKALHLLTHFEWSSSKFVSSQSTITIT